MDISVPRVEQISEDSPEHIKSPKIGTDYTFKRNVVWFNAIGFLALHLAAIYGFFLCFRAHTLTVLWMLFLILVSGEGITIGAHRLYSHKSFKATLFVQFILVLLQTVAGQNCLYIWVRDHRQHHKYSDTDADPHNANRGFFFSHIGWLMSRKHPSVIDKGKTINMSDLESDPLVMFQKKYYKTLYVIFALMIPVMVPFYFWKESLYNSIFISFFARYVLMLNVTWLINSATHIYGTKPYDNSINPVENFLVSTLAMGEGWHNYHHSFPSDYKAAEYGLRYSFTTFVIDVLWYLGLVYDLKEAPVEVVDRKALKMGDGSRQDLDSTVESLPKNILSLNYLIFKPSKKMWF